MNSKTFLPQPGDKLIDRFVLQEIIGVGPISGVFRAFDEALSKDVILKFLYPGLAGTSFKENNLFRLYRARGFLHKNILSVHEVFEGDGYFFLIKDIVDGISLRALQKLRQENLEPFNKREIVHLVFEICEALRWIHMLGANGNLKPENILLTDNSLRVDDPYFLAGRSMVPVEHGNFPAADRYLAPEQLEDEQQERKESDIYALALILGEVIIGKPVKPATALSDQGPFFSPELDDVFMRATAAAPSDRYQSISMFWDAVRQVFRVPADAFQAQATPVAFIPESLTDAAMAFRPFAETPAEEVEDSEVEDEIEILADEPVEGEVEAEVEVIEDEVEEVQEEPEIQVVPEDVAEIEDEPESQVIEEDIEEVQEEPQIEVIEEDVEEVREEDEIEVIEEDVEEVQEEPQIEIIEEDVVEVQEEPQIEIIEEDVAEVQEEDEIEIIEEEAAEVQEEPQIEIVEEDVEEVREEPLIEIVEEVVAEVQAEDEIEIIEEEVEEVQAEDEIEIIEEEVEEVLEAEADEPEVFEAEDDDEKTLQDMRLPEVMEAEAEEGIFVVDDFREPAPVSPEQIEELEAAEAAVLPPETILPAELTEESQELIAEVERIIEETRELEELSDDEEVPPDVPMPSVPADIAAAQAVVEGRDAEELPTPEPPEPPAGSTLMMPSVQTLHELSQEMDLSEELSEVEISDSGVVTLGAEDPDDVAEAEVLADEEEAVDAVVEVEGDEPVVEVEEDLPEAPILEVLVEESDDAGVVVEVEPEIEVVAEEDVEDSGQQAEDRGQRTEDSEEPEIELIELEEEEEEEAIPEQPAALPPERGYRVDSEYWAYKDIEEDKDLDEVLDSVQVGEPHDEDEEVMLLSDEVDEPVAPPSPPAAVTPETRPAPLPRPTFEKRKDKKSPLALFLVLGFVAVLVVAAVVVVSMMGDEKKGEKKEPQVAQNDKAAEGKTADKKKADKKKADKKKADKKKADKKKADKKKAAEKRADAKKAAKKKADAKKAADKKKADAKKAADADKGGDKKVPDALDQKALALKAEEEAARLAETRTALVQTLKPMEAKIAAASPLIALIGEANVKIAELKAGFDGLDEKARKADEQWGETLAGLAKDADSLSRQGEVHNAMLEELRATLEQADTLEAIEPLGAQRAEFEKDIEGSHNATVDFLKAWYGVFYGRRLAAFAKHAEQLPGKAKEWEKVKNEPEAKAVAGLHAKVLEDAKKWQATLDGTQAMTAETAPDVTKGLAELLAAVEADDKLVTAALARKVAKPADDTVEVKVDTGPEAARKNEISKLQKKISSHDKSLRKHRGKLTSKAKEWKKAGDSKKQKAVDAAISEIEKLHEGLSDIQKMLKGGNLDDAKFAFSMVEGSISPAEKKAKKLEAEKVVTEKVEVGGDKTVGQDELKAYLKTLKCPGGMQRIVTKNPKAKKDKTAPPYVAYCIDRYEYPGKGSKPKTNVSWDAANGACQAKGKRLCQNWEWKTACGGKYPYGRSFDPDSCNTVDDDGLEQEVLPAGSKPKCKGRGLYDMVGNVAEWTAQKTVNGGDCYKTAEEATCYRSVKRFGGSGYVGFRCCADAE